MITRPLPHMNPPLDDYREYIYETNAIVILYAEMVQKAALIPDDDALNYALSGMIGVCRLSRDVNRDLQQAKAKEGTSNAA